SSSPSPSPWPCPADAVPTPSPTGGRPKAPPAATPPGADAPFDSDASTQTAAEVQSGTRAREPPGQTTSRDPLGRASSTPLHVFATSTRPTWGAPSPWSGPGSVDTTPLRNLGPLALAPWANPCPATGRSRFARERRSTRAGPPQSARDVLEAGPV